jgi:hypothetical protein
MDQPLPPPDWPDVDFKDLMPEPAHYKLGV